MGTPKRERQKAGRAARVEAAQAAEAKARNRRRMLTFGGLVVVFGGLIGLAALLSSDDETDTATVAGPTSTFEVALGDAAGVPCVELADPLPEGAPEVPVPVGEAPPTELIVEDLAPGDGAEITPGSSVTVDYIGVACSTGGIFDDSYSKGQPATFPLDGVIQGWTDGLVGMRVGGTRLLVIPPDQGYGELGSPPDIKPNETLVFVVEAIETQPPAEAPAEAPGGPAAEDPAAGAADPAAGDPAAGAAAG